MTKYSLKLALSVIIWSRLFMNINSNELGGSTSSTDKNLEKFYSHTKKKTVWDLILQNLNISYENGCQD